MLPVANVGISNSTMQVFIDRLNTIATAMTEQVLTANSQANGAVNSGGNAYFTGTFAGNVISIFGNLRGGNVQSQTELVISSNTVHNGTEIVSNSGATTTTTANQVMDSFSANNYRTTKYLIQITNSSNYTATELLLIHDGANVQITEYATLNTNGALGTFQANTNSGNVNLLFSPVNSINTVKFTRTSLAV